MTSRFPNQIRKVTPWKLAPNCSTQPLDNPSTTFPRLSLLILNPGPASGGFLDRCRPELGSRLAVGHPQGLALRPARTTPHSQSRKQVHTNPNPGGFKINPKQVMINASRISDHDH